MGGCKNGFSGRHFSIDAGLDGLQTACTIWLWCLKSWKISNPQQPNGCGSQEQPNYLPAQRGLIDAWFQLGKIEEIEQQGTALGQSRDRSLSPLPPYCEGRIAELRGDVDGALIAFDLSDRIDAQDAANSYICRLCRIRTLVSGALTS